MAETAKVATLRQDSQRGDRADTRQGLQTLKIGITRKQLLRTVIQLIPVPI